MTKKDRVYNGILALMPLIVFFPQYFSNHIMAWLDFSFYFLPFRMLTAYYIQHGIMPFWNPFIYCGNPLMANMQSAVFYPLNIFFHVMPAIAAVRITTYITFTVMAIFMYAFMRLYKVSEEGGFLAAVVFAFGFYSMIKAVEFAEISVMAWLPAALYFTKRFALTGRRHDFFMIPLMLSLSLLGGHAQFFIYVWLLFTAFFVYENIYLKGGFRFKGIRDYFVINIILLGLSFIQLLPAARFVLLSKRAAGGVGYEEVMGGFLNFNHILSFFFPFLNGLFDTQSNFLNWMGLINTGVFSILLMMLGFFFVREYKLRVFLSGVFTFFLFLTFLGCMPFYKGLFDVFPFMASMRYQSKAILCVLFIICVFLGMGFDELFNRTKKELKSFVLFSVTAFFAILLVYLFADLYKNNIMTAYRKIFEPGIAFQRVFDTVQSYNLVLLKFLIFTVIFGAAVFIIYMAGNEMKRGTGIKTAAVIFALISLFAFQSWEMFRYFRPDIIEKKTKQMDFLVNKSNIGQSRILAPPLFNALQYDVYTDSNEQYAYYCIDSLLPNFPMYYRIKNADGFDSLFTGDFAYFKSCFNAADAPWNKPAFRLFSAKYVASMVKISSKNMKLVSTGVADIYENTNYLAPAFLIKYPFETVIADKMRAREILSGDSFNPLKTLILEKEPDKFPDVKGAEGVSGITGDTKVSLDMPDPNTYLVKTDSLSAGVLVLTDNYYPGWKAYVDGIETKIMKVDLTFKGVFLDAGSHTVYFKYSPPEFFFCALISIVLLILLMPLVPFLLALF